jgi:hypothetical protein
LNAKNIQQQVTDTIFEKRKTALVHGLPQGEHGKPKGKELLTQYLLSNSNSVVAVH